MEDERMNRIIFIINFEQWKKSILLFISILFFFSSFLKAQELYVGANYHPHDDKNPEKAASDIRLMKDAGFKVVRMGHLAWDSYEPSEG
jgi:beta-galactosidase